VKLVRKQGIEHRVDFRISRWGSLAGTGRKLGKVHKHLGYCRFSDGSNLSRAIFLIASPLVAILWAAFVQTFQEAIRESNPWVE
jgi:hypothetical protein